MNIVNSILSTRDIPVLWRRSIFIGGGAALLALGLGLFVQDQYTSVARLLPMSKGGGNLGALAALQSMGGLSLGGQSSQMEQALPEILRSRSLLDSVLTRTYRFHRRTWRFGGVREESGTLEEVLGAQNRDVAIQRFIGAVDVQRELKTGVVTIKVTLPSEELAQAVNLALLSELEAFLIRHRSERGKATADYMKDRVQSTRAELENALGRYLHFVNRNRTYTASLDPVIRIDGQKLEYEVEYRRQVLLRLQQQVDAAMLEEKDATPVLSVLDHPTRPIQKTRPSRVIWALAAFLVATALVYAWDRRDELFPSNLGVHS